MTTVVASGTAGFDMLTYLNFSHFTSGTFNHTPGAAGKSDFSVTANDGTVVKVHSDAADFQYNNDADPASQPSQGTLSSATIDSAANGTPTGSHAAITGIPPLHVQDLPGIFLTQGSKGFLNAIFGGNDTFTDSGFGDKFEGFGGNDTFNLTKVGDDTAIGDGGADTFRFTNISLTSADKIGGGTDAAIDTISITTGGSLDTHAFDNVLHVERVVLALPATRYSYRIRCRHRRMLRMGSPSSATPATTPWTPPHSPPQTRFQSTPAQATIRSAGERAVTPSALRQAI